MHYCYTLIDQTVFEAITREKHLSCLEVQFQSFPDAFSLDIALFLQNSKAIEILGLSLVSEEELAEPKISEDKL